VRLSARRGAPTRVRGPNIKYKARCPIWHGPLLLQDLCQHNENKSKRERGHNEMRDPPPLAQVKVVSHHFGFLWE
jgi:hypothetical protein